MIIRRYSALRVPSRIEAGPIDIPDYLETKVVKRFQATLRCAGFQATTCNFPKELDSANID